jgi:sulfide dehydrogenase cytochrome subunit
VKKGAQLHRDYCESCHRYDGRKDEHDSGILAGQWMPYLKISLSEFMTTDRPSPTKLTKRMEFMIQDHGEESLEELVHFYGSQQ